MIELKNDIEKTFITIGEIKKIILSKLDKHAHVKIEADHDQLRIYVSSLQLGNKPKRFRIISVWEINDAVEIISKLCDQFNADCRIARDRDEH